jgi:DNA helicase-2/ATP-dependent DNA helicase PcrA
MAWDSDLDPQSPAYQIAADNSQFIRVLADPGTGKSFALKRRVARRLEKRHRTRAHSGGDLYQSGG